MKDKTVKKLKLLTDNPFAFPYKKIKGRDNTYRIRIGDFRVIYSVRGLEIRILINVKESTIGCSVFKKLISVHCLSFSSTVMFTGLELATIELLAIFKKVVIVFKYDRL